jgi:tRNA G18 (ribose-2'-O)-methylase SpoU
MVAEQTTASIRSEQLRPAFPAVLVLGGESSGVSPEVLQAADAVVVIPMLGMANSLNVATVACDPALLAHGAL